MKPPPDGWDPDERDALDELPADLAALRARHDGDPPIDLLRAARHDALPEDLQGRAERRLSADPWARAIVDGLDAADAELDAAARDRMLSRIRRQTMPERRMPLRQFGALALGAAALLAIAVWLMPSISPSVPSAEPTVAGTPPANPPVATRVELPLEQPPIALSLSALTWRGGSADNPLLRDLKQPLDAFRERDYARADRAFAALETQYPQAVEVFFYGGVARLFVNDPARAVPALARAAELADTTFAPRVAWYRAVAEHRAGQIDAARARLDTVCRGGGEYSARACQATKEIGAAKNDGR
jgi:hypothetical protein